MKDTPTRVFGLMCVLVGVWTTVYWLYEPAEPPVTFDQTPSREIAAADGSSAPSRGPMAELSPPISTPERRPQAQPQPRANPAVSSNPEKDLPRTKVVAPEFWEYSVQPGDSMEIIAKKLFGDGRLWTKIAEANPWVDARKLIPGRTKLQIPKDLGNIQGKEIPVPQATPDKAPSKPTPAPAPGKQSPPATAAAQEYVVKNGDTLSGIAKALYGKSSLWRKIYDANKDVIDNPDAVKPGITIRIPPQD